MCGEFLLSFLYLGGRFTMTIIPFTFRANFWTWIWIFGHFGQIAARDYNVRLRKSSLSVSCPNMWQFVVISLIFNANFTLTMMLFYFPRKSLKEFPHLAISGKMLHMTIIWGWRNIAFPQAVRMCREFL